MLSHYHRSCLLYTGAQGGNERGYRAHTQTHIYTHTHHILVERELVRGAEDDKVDGVERLQKTRAWFDQYRKYARCGSRSPSKSDCEKGLYPLRIVEQVQGCHSGCQVMVKRLRARTRTRDITEPMPHTAAPKTPTHTLMWGPGRPLCSSHNARMPETSKDPMFHTIVPNARTHTVLSTVLSSSRNAKKASRDQCFTQSHPRHSRIP